MEKILATLGIQAINKGVYTSGRWCAEGGLFESINPSQDKMIAQVTSATRDLVEEVIHNAGVAQRAWLQVPMPHRGAMLREIGEALRQNKESLGALISIEMGKSLREGEGEVQEMIDMADFVTGLSRQVAGTIFPSERANHQLEEVWHPLGVITVITAFNFPVAVWAWNAFIGAMCGNAIIWKPSHKTPLCAIAVMHLVNQVMERHGHAGVFSLCISREHETVLPLVDDARIALVSFTGSSRAGVSIHQRIAKRLSRSLLELGGNNAVIIEKSALLEVAIPAVLFGAIGTSGQRCTTTRRVYIQRECFDEVSQRLAQAYSQIRVGDPLDEQVHMGPLVDKDAVILFENLVKRLHERKAKILSGAKVISKIGCFVEPTLVIAEPSWDLLQEENFVPVLYLVPYDNLNDAIAMNNDVPQGLSSSLFTQDIAEAYHFLSALGSDCGLANVNVGTSGAEIGAAFGGEKQTGQGREAGSDAWKAYMRRQTHTINWGGKLPLAQGIKFKL